MNIKLKIPKILISDTTDEKGNFVQGADMVSQGNFQTIIERGGTTETDNRRYADWLIREHGFVEAEAEEVPAQQTNNVPDLADHYPAEYPGRKAFIEAGIPRETAKNLTREQLVAVPNIGGKIADAVLTYEEENGGAE